MNRIVGPQNYRQWIVLAIGAIAVVSFSIGNVAIAEGKKERHVVSPPSVNLCTNRFLKLAHD